MLLALVAGAVLAAPAGASQRLAGNVWEIDVDAGRVTILDAGQRHSFTYGSDTIVRRGSTDRSVQDLRRGDRIVVSLSGEDGASHARLIAIAGPPGPSRGFSFP